MPFVTLVVGAHKVGARRIMVEQVIVIVRGQTVTGQRRKGAIFRAIGVAKNFVHNNVHGVVRLEFVALVLHDTSREEPRDLEDEGEEVGNGHVEPGIGVESRSLVHGGLANCKVPEKCKGKD